MKTVCAYNCRDYRWSSFSRWSLVKMAEEGSSLFCDDDKSCEKHPNETDEDGEKYISAPIGMITLVLSTVFFFGRFSLSNSLWCCPTRFHELLCFFRLTAKLCITWPFDVMINFFLLYPQINLDLLEGGFDTVFSAQFSLEHLLL